MSDKNIRHFKSLLDINKSEFLRIIKRSIELKKEALSNTINNSLKNKTSKNVTANILDCHDMAVKDHLANIISLSVINLNNSFPEISLILEWFTNVHSLFSDLQFLGII